MKKEIKIYELFSGLGSQLYALKRIDKNLKVKSLGACDFYIDAIVSYMIIHHGVLEPENTMSKQEMAEILNSFHFSSDSKNVVSANYFSKIKEEKLRGIFPYLYSFVNNEYLNSKYSKGEREREREFYWH